MDQLKLKLTFVFLLLTQLTFSQLSNFTLTVNHTDETCTGNGSLTFSVSNTTPGSTILYSIYLLPDVANPISIQSGGSLSGLNAGTYRVVATQSLAGNSGTQQQDVIILDEVEALTYQVNSINEICGNDGRITVNVLSGNLTANGLNYELFSGPMIRELQASNVFNNLTAGTYQVRVYDACGEGVVQTFTVQPTNPALDVEFLSPALASCTSVNVGFSFESLFPSPFGVVKFPLQVTTTVFPPTGGSITYNQTVNGGFTSFQQVPFYTNQPYNYSITFTDGCGTVYTHNGVIDNLSIAASYTVLPQGCIYKQVSFFNVATVTLVSAPAAFTTSLPQSYTSQIVNNSVTILYLVEGTYVFNTTDICGNPQVFTIEIIIVEIAPPFISIFGQNCTTGSLSIYGISEIIMVSAPATYQVTLPHDYTSLINSADYITFVNLPVGIYIFDVLDLCGAPHTLEIHIDPISVIPEIFVREGCQDGTGAIRMIGEFTAISLITAPVAYQSTLPQNLYGNLIINNTNLVIDSLPAGNYVIQSTNSCNVTTDTAFTILGHQDTTNVAVIPNCGSFDLNLNNTSTNTGITTYWLQKLNTVTNDWGHPATGTVYVEGVLPDNSNSIPLINNTINYNLAYQGHFRILKVFRSFVSNSIIQTNCFKTIYEFDYNGLPMIEDVYSISCGSTFEVIVMAVGFDPLQYRITLKNGQPFLVENGNSNIFTGLEPATYNFQVQDACGNFLNSAFEIVNPNPLEITANQVFCDGDNLTLSVPNFSFFQYQWWKDNDTTNILSTTSSLNFNPFNAAANNGTYHVSISYSNNPNSCLNQVLSYVVLVTNIPPNAGNSGSFSYCGRQGTIDLFSLLQSQGNYDSGGTWDEMTSSGTLSGNLWNTGTVPYGSYEFRYHVDGSCSLFDEAFINIIIYEIPAIPVASVDSIICESGSLQLYATTILNGTYQWTGPNGFMSTEQNPIISNLSADNNGTYTVSASQNGCQSGTSSVAVLVNALPQFDLSQNCIQSEYVVTATPIAGSFDASMATYAWTGPNNFTAAQNPIVITGGEVGLYNLTVTDVNGCSASQTIDVVRTICFIPNVITPNDDTTNESFNLAGFEVDRIEIYNRWGRKVYEKNNYIDEWHGQNMNGERLPDSTYYYILNLRTGENKAGWIFLSANR
ncbi:gliding motility-associated C-terminal domain-containing protein [Flavobacterium sp. J49]|uniref:T9SS type B sorting domain-containing protein n=1 Tax=Flavobacterium sp. J49 TaxID=2718534 RepID=UPI0015938E53|nr:gliding motility-associated C-terminal domain-containing protein [Flavobacterium sp. J49]MBF6640405.1 gliding motility-associated C-terminal domain-containing protein [Flavobacterium sp. J49]NIC01652.1 gliding motility-associated C-terminal domain-containing protein [Flavobacterium sp. J49]